MDSTWCSCWCCWFAVGWFNWIQDQGMARYGLGIARQSWQATWATLSSWSMRDKPFWWFETIRERTWFWAVGWHTTGQRSPPLNWQEHPCGVLSAGDYIGGGSLGAEHHAPSLHISSRILIESCCLLISIDIWPRFCGKTFQIFQVPQKLPQISVSMVSMVSLASEHFVSERSSHCHGAEAGMSDVDSAITPRTNQDMMEKHQDIRCTSMIFSVILQCRFYKLGFYIYISVWTLVSIVKLYFYDI